MYVLVGPLGINPDMLELVELELQQLLGEIHVDFDTVKKRAIMKATVSKWKCLLRVCYYYSNARSIRGQEAC